MKTKWKSFAYVEKDKEYLGLVSCLKLKSFWDTPKFMKFGIAIQRQLAKSKGLVGYLMSMEPFSKTYGTLSVWESEDALMKFTKELPHSNVMEEMITCLDGRAIYARWKIKASEIPPVWEIAVKRLPSE